MTAPTDNTPVQPSVGQRTVTRGLTTLTTVLAILLALTVGYIVATDVVPYIKRQASTASQDPYRNWPAAGTKPPFAGEKPFTAQGIIALTCRDGKAHIDENMLVGSALRNDMVPSWFVQMYVDYDQSSYQGFCEVRLAPLTSNVKLYKLTLHAGKGWAAHSNTLSFDGLDSITAQNDGQDIALVLINSSDERIDPGVEIKLGNNGILAPSRELLKT